MMADYFAGRGKLTQRVIDKGKELFGRDIDKTELRLIPYIVYTMMNDQKLDPNKVNQEEREILAMWRRQGHIEGGASGLAVTKDFWDKCCEMVFLAYVDLEGQQREPFATLPTEDGQ